MDNVQRIKEIMQPGFDLLLSHTQRNGFLSPGEYLAEVHYDTTFNQLLHDYPGAFDKVAEKLAAQMTDSCWNDAELVFRVVNCVTNNQTVYAPHDKEKKHPMKANIPFIRFALYAK